MPAHVAHGTATRARLRARVEPVCAEHKRRLGLGVRTVGFNRTRTKITRATRADTIRRLPRPEGRPAPA